MALFTPQGDIGAQEKTLILVALGLMLLVVIPVIALTLYFAWRYRASNTKARKVSIYSNAPCSDFPDYTFRANFSSRPVTRLPGPAPAGSLTERLNP